MSDILVCRSNGNQIQPSRELNPLSMFRDLLRFDPFQEMAPLWPETRTTAFLPAFEIKETKDAYLFKADVPGVKETDVEVTLTGNRLTVSGHREEEREEQHDTYYACERSYGSFSRSFTLPEGANGDQVHAEMKAGVLTVAVPKKPDMQPKKVAVKSDQKNIKA